MPKFSEMTESRFLKKDDAARPLLLTIQRFAQENMAMEGQTAEMKWVVYFREHAKGLVLNTTNQQLMELATGSDTTEGAVGKQVVVYNDPSVSMGGKLVGGLRIRAPKNQAVQPAPAPPAPQPEPPTEPDDSDVPF